MAGLLSLKTRLRRLFTTGPAAPALVLAMPTPASRPPGAPRAAPGPFQGYVDAASHRHVAGWVRDLSNPGARVDYRVVATLDGAETVLHRGTADEYTAHLETIGVGDGTHAFYARFARRLSDAERDTIAVQVCATGQALELAPAVAREWNPVRYVALDIVDNCNLRCPFCLFDYDGVNRTNAMAPAHFEAALRLAPYTSPGNFWLSCLHEPVLHPKFQELLEMIPPDDRKKVFYTTNLAKRMPQNYYDLLADSGLHHLNISIESFDPEIYERMRKGAKHRIFSANWDILLEAFARGTAPPKLRYIIMGYKSNLAELPTLVRRLREEKRAWQVEIRFTYPEKHIPAAFAAAEFLDDADWAWVREQLASYGPDEVILITPPPTAAAPEAPMGPVPEAPMEPVHEAPMEPVPEAPTEPVSEAASEPPPSNEPSPLTGPRPRSVYVRITQDGVVHVNAAFDIEDEHDTSYRAVRVATAHVDDIEDADAFLAALVE